LQETKAHAERLDKDPREPHGYYAYRDYPRGSKGYSGGATLTKEEPRRVQNGFDVAEFDTEGRTMIAEYPLVHSS